jgi:hypothetical protein
VRVPEEAGLGKANMKMSFADWKEGKVIPATVDIPVLEQKPEKKGAGP